MPHKTRVSQVSQIESSSALERLSVGLNIPSSPTGATNNVRGRSGLLWCWIGLLSVPPASIRTVTSIDSMSYVLIRTFEPATEVPENIYRPLYRRRTPHLYSEDDVTRLMKAAWRLQRVTPFRQLTVYALIGLLASTGLRIGEARVPLPTRIDSLRLQPLEP